MLGFAIGALGTSYLGPAVRGEVPGERARENGEAAAGAAREIQLAMEIGDAAAELRGRGQLERARKRAKQAREIGARARRGTAGN